MERGIGTSPTALMPGEQVIVQEKRSVGRRGRNVVRVRVVGQHSLGWLESAWLWGSSVEAFVGGGSGVTRLISILYPDVFFCSAYKAQYMLPHGAWVGAQLTTIRDDADAALNFRLAEAWRPSWI